MSPSFDNIINIFKSGTKQAVNQASRATRITKLKVDLMTLKAERANFLQSLGEKTYQLFLEKNTFDGLLECTQNEFTMIQRIEKHIQEIETEITNLQTLIKTWSTEDPKINKLLATESQESETSESSPKDDQQS